MTLVSLLPPLLSVLVAETGPVLDTSLRTEGRARAVTVGGSSPGTVSQIEVDPRASLTLGSSGTELTLGYYPQLVWTDGAGAGLASDPQVLHNAALVSTWRPDRSFRLSGTLVGSYGMNDLTWRTTGSTPPGLPTPTVPPPAQPIPEKTTIHYLSVDATVAADTRLSSPLLLRMSAGAFVNGGADDDARAYLPLQRGVRASLALDAQLSRSDLLSSSVSGTASAFSMGVSDWLLWLQESWTHDFRRSTQGWISAGYALTLQRETTLWRSLPTGELGVRTSRRLGRDLFDLVTLVRGAPIQDRITGAIYLRADAAASIAWRPSPSWLTAATATGGVVVGGVYAGEQVGTGELRGAWSTGRLEISGGARIVEERQPSLASQRYAEWGTFLALTLRERWRS